MKHIFRNNYLYENMYSDKITKFTSIYLVCKKRGGNHIKKKLQNEN